MKNKFLLLLAFALAHPTAAFASDLALTPDVDYQGHRSAELAADWWQWAQSVSDDTNPVRDLTGVHCAVGQGGDVWFLAGGFGSSKIRRTCTVPADKALFFPLVNMVFFPTRGNDTYTCEAAKAEAAFNNDSALDLFAELDGSSIEDPKRFRVASEACFDIFARVPATSDPYRAFPSATDGYWLFLRPLPQGRHILKFGGRYNRSSKAYGRMVQDIEYELLVQ